MSVTAVAEEQVYAESAAPVWWVFLITGTAWLVLSLIMFRFDITSAKTIGVIAGIVFLVAGLIEFGMVAVVESGWWKALNAFLGVLLVVGGILAFIHPANAFVAVASIIGFMFLVVGIFDLIVAFSDRTGLWWVRMISGFICIGLAFWASGDFQHKSILLIVWLGLFALFRGINSFIVAFTLHHIDKELAADAKAIGAIEGRGS
jgi:uncharacterized membrane protein HdeD (DUF308 family)